MAIFYNNKPLNKVEFDDVDKVFTISDDSREYSISVPYIPKLESERYDANNFHLFLFENNHLNAENDVFQLYDKDKDYRVGWIFPISVLDSNENDFAENEHLNRYKLVAYQILLSKNFDYKIEIDRINDEISISEVYGDDTVIVILSKEKIQNSNFNIHSYYPSLASYGYYPKNENKLSITYPIDYLTEKFRGKTRLYLKYTENKILSESESFVIKLYENYLKELDHHLIRFHLLYQIIEYFITNEFSLQFEKLLQEYKDKKITKNNFIEKINNIRSERENIRNIFEQLNFNDNSFEKEIKVALERNAKDFLEECNVEVKNNLGDLIYAIRNMIVHNYREITKNENLLELLDKITYEFEIIVNYLIVNSP